MTQIPHVISDEDLTAYLDGEASSDLKARIKAANTSGSDVRARLAALNISGLNLADVLDPETLNSPALPKDLGNSGSRGSHALLFPLAMAASFAIGIGLTVALRPAPSADMSPDWVTAIASYQALYVTETLSGAKQESAITAQKLSTANALLGVDLAPAQSLGDLSLRRVQMLGFGGTPLIQMAYLDQAGTPFAFCITKTNEADREARAETRFDLATASWVRNGIGYVLIGGTQTDLVQDLAMDLATRL